MSRLLSTLAIYIERKKNLKIVCFSLLLIIPLFFAMNTLTSGNIDFGYDHARDFLLGLNNLNKLTLIGPTSGIPGIFYGPYWIWLISFGLRFSYDPRLVVLIILTIPYFIVFPYTLLRFRKLFGFYTCLILWVLFINSTGIKYATSPWNPHPAPLLFLILIYVTTFTNFLENNFKRNSRVFLIGFLSGLITNFHISLGLGVMSGMFIFFFIQFILMLKEFTKKKKEFILNYLSIILFFGLGIFITYLPFFFFELRHGFNQISTALRVLASKGSVVRVIGLSKKQIAESFFGTIGTLLKIPILYGVGFIVLSFGYFCFMLKKNKILLKKDEITLIILLSSLSSGIMLLYLLSKNPVWGYHFIGVEIIFLFLIGLIISKIRLFKFVVGFWVTIIVVLSIPEVIKSFNQNPYINSNSFATEQRIVKIISRDGGKNNFNVFAYSPSIYVYEYAYLFKWIDDKDISYDPGISVKKTDLVYLILPPSKNAIRQDFINFKTPDKMYQTIKQWSFEDGTLILKRKSNT